MHGNMGLQQCAMPQMMQHNGEDNAEMGNPMGLGRHACRSSDDDVLRMQGEGRSEDSSML